MDIRKPVTTSTGKLSKKFNRVSEADDLPDITVELMAALNGKWVSDDAMDDPVRQLVQTVREHMDAINPYIEAVKVTQPAWYANWSQIYVVAQELDNALDGYIDDRYYSVPKDLELAELAARANLNKADSDWEQAKLDYVMEIDRRNAEIQEIKKTINLITEAKDLDVLNKYDTHPSSMVKTNQTNGISSFFSALGIHPKPAVAKPVSEDVQHLKTIRDKLLVEYNDNLIFKTNSLKEFAEFAPKKNISIS